MYLITAFLCGLIFGGGLTISNMINPNKVLGFLDITGNWDPSLALVMASAVIIAWIGYRYILKIPTPMFAKKFCLPDKTSIDKPLIFGSILFGIGWGLAGYCPGPALTALGLGFADAAYFVIGMLISSISYGLLKHLFRFIKKDFKHE